MKIFLILFLIFFNKFILLSETNITNFLLVTDNEDRYGFVSNEELEDVAGIYSFKKNKENFYDLKKTVQKFNIKLNLIDSLSVTVFSNSDVIIVSDADYPDEKIDYSDIQKIINLKNSEKINLLNISKYLCLTSFLKENKDLLLIQESIIIEKEEGSKILTYDEIKEQLKRRKLKYYMLNSITGEQNNIDKEVWRKNFINLYPLCYINDNYVNMRNARYDEKLFPVNSEFTKKIQISENGEQLLKLFSIGSNKYYFVSAYTEKSYFYYYDTNTKMWNYIQLEGKISDTIGFGDCIAIKHIYPELKEQRISNGFWTFLRDGEIIDRVNLGISSKVLFFQDDEIIFSNDCRLYSAKISRKGLYNVKKIAEHNLIRFARKLYFPKKENLESKIDK